MSAPSREPVEVPPDGGGGARRTPPADWLVPAVEAQGLPRYLDMLRAGRWLVIGAFLLTVAAAVGYLTQAEKTYEAQADLLISPMPRDAPVVVPGLIRESSDPTRDVETVARLVESPTVARRVIERLELDTTPKGLLEQVEAAPVAQSNIVAITAKGDAPREAADRANAFGEAMVADRTERLHAQLDGQIERLRAQVAALTPEQRASPESPASQLPFLQTLREGPDPTVQLEVRAEPPTEPSSPRPVLTLAAAIIGGLVLGIVGAFSLQLLDPRLRREEQLRNKFRLPILARVPLERGRRRKKPLLPNELSLGALDSYQTLRAALTTSRKDALTGRVVLVTGPSPGDGKTTAAINLASTVAAAGKRVILIEADTRRPSIGRALGIRPERGLASVISGRTYLVDALVSVGGEDSKLRVLLNSPDEAPTADVLSHISVDTLLLQAQRLADWVIVDSPPLNHVAETLAIAKMVDDVVLVVRMGKSNLRDLNELAEMLQQQEISPTGFVVLGGQARQGYY